MKFDLKKANYGIELHSVFGMKMLISAKRFYFGGETKDLINQIETISKDPVISKYGNYQVRVVIIDIINKKSRSFVYTTTPPTSESELHELQADFRERINYITDVMDVKQNIYRLSVNNHLSNEYDTRCIRFHSQGKEHDIVQAIKARMNKLESKIKEEDSVLVFTGDDPNVKTHRVTITKANNLEDGRKYMNLKSFTVRFPTYSSGEIIERWKDIK